MSLSSILSIARSALFSHQRAMDVTGHNIANASTEGYTRQRARIIAAVPQRFPEGFIGRGVRFVGIDRSRDQFLDSTFRREAGSLAQFSMLNGTLAEIEGVFGEPSEFGLAATLDAFWASWGDLANNPLSGAVRAVVRSQGRQLANQFNAMATRLDDIRAQTFERLRGDVEEVNQLITQIADLNLQIVAGGGDGRNAPDLSDQRDVMLDRLSELVQLQVVRNGDGSIRITGGDVMLVDRASIHTLTVTTSASGDISIGADGGTVTVDVMSGRLAAHVDLLANGLPGIRTQLDNIAAAVVSEVNTLHSGGVTLSGVPAGDFFLATSLTASSITLATAIEQSGNNIGAGTGSGPGDGSVALNIAALRDAAVPTLGNLTIGGYYTSVVASLGQDVRSAGEFAVARQVLVANIETRRASVNEVSIDEEMVNLIIHQTAFAAATRLVTAADEMMQDLLRMV